jgi:hypothetical protein
VTAYGNPQPYPDADLERSVLAGRITAARQIRDLYAAGTPRHTSWQATVDALLEHYASADVRATTTAMEVTA